MAATYIAGHPLTAPVARSLWPRAGPAMGTPVTNRREKLLAKLWSKTVMIDGPLDTPCRIWTGQDSGKGRGGNYGRLTVDGGTMATNIVSFVIENGPIPPKKQIDHRCNNRRCWTPDHLQMVTHLKNQRLRAKRAKMVCEPLKEVV